jgi:hypothetical protein
MFDYANKIYNIQNTIDFATDSNTSVTLPAGCVLKFNGGQLKNTGSGTVTITGNNTIIEAGLAQIIGANVVLSGTWKCKSIHDEWFGGVSAKTKIAKPGTGCLYYNSTSNKYEMFNGTAWTNLDGTALS